MSRAILVLETMYTKLRTYSMSQNTVLKSRISGDDETSGNFFTSITAISFITFFYLITKFFGGKGISKQGEVQTYILFFLSVPIIGLITSIVESYFKDNLSDSSVTKKVFSALSIVIPAGIILWGLTGISLTVYHTWAEVPDTSIVRFTIGALSILLFLVSAYLYKNKAPHTTCLGSYIEKSLEVLFYIIGFGLIALLFDVNITFETLSYAAYIGPAVEVMNNKLPLVDVYSQYGLNYLLFVLVYKLLPWSLYSASLVVAALDIIYYFTFIIVTLKLAQQKTFAFFCIVLSILFLHASSLYNVTFTPSVLAMRFIPSMLLALAITFMPKHKNFTVFSILATALCALWSFECFILSLGIYTSYHGIYLLANKKQGIKIFSFNFLKTASCLLIPYLSIFAYYLLVLNVMPSLKPYAELLRGQKTPEAAWVLPTDPNIKTWVLFGLTYGIGLAYATFSAWKCKATDDTRIKRLACIGAMSALGIGQFSYYACRSTTPILVIVAFPMTILFALFLDDLYHNYKLNKKLSIVNVTYRMFGIVMLVIMGGVFADRFFRPMTLLSSNSTILRSCFLPGSEYKCSPIGIFNHYKKLVTPLATYPKKDQIYGFVPDSNENEAAYHLIKKWQPNEKRVALFILDNFTVLFLLNKLHSLETPHSMVDGLSKTLTAKTLKKADNLKAGDIVYIGNTTRSVLDQKAVKLLQNKWTFCHIDTAGETDETLKKHLGGGGAINVYRLEALGSKCKKK